MEGDIWDKSSVVKDSSLSLINVALDSCDGGCVITGSIGWGTGKCLLPSDPIDGTDWLGPLEPSEAFQIIVNDGFALPEPMDADLQGCSLK